MVRTYFTNIKCIKCGKEGLTSETALRERIGGIKTGKWLCGNCYLKKHYEQRKYKQNKYNLDPDSSTGIGYITETLVSKFLGIPTCFEITGNFNYPKYDLLEHEDWGKIDVKGSTYHPYRKNWEFTTNHNKKPDFFFCIGYDVNRRNVERVYYIPNDYDIHNMRVIHIYVNWYQEEDPYNWFRQDPKPWNDLFHTLKLENCPVLRLRDKPAK